MNHIFKNPYLRRYRSMIDLRDRVRWQKEFGIKKVLGNFHRDHEDKPILRLNNKGHWLDRKGRRVDKEGYLLNDEGEAINSNADRWQAFTAYQTPQARHFREYKYLQEDNLSELEAYQEYQDLQTYYKIMERKRRVHLFEA